MRPPSKDTPQIHVATLGGLRIERDGEEIRDLLAQPVRCALFLYVAIKRRATRDELAVLLWPERSDERARHSLSQTLYELRRRLGDDWVTANGDHVEVASAVTVDALEFIAATEAGEDEVAVQAYRGAFLEGSHVGETAAFEAWVDRRRSQLARLHRDVCRRLIGARIERTDTAGALAVAHHWVEIDPLEDEAHHRLIELLARMGRRSEALRHYEGYADLIGRELDLEPLEGTQALIARIREGDSPQTGEPDGTVLVETDPGPGPTRAPPHGPEAPARSRPGVPAGSEPVRRDRRVPGARLGQGWLLGMLVIIVLAGVGVVWRGSGGVQRAVSSVDPPLDPRGIAVLPFVNMTPDPDQEYFSDGVTEDLLTALSQIADLNVIARTSVMQYKGTTKTVRQIGEELGVAHVLEGSVRRVEDRVRITAQLIDAATDGHLWSGTYDRELTDIFGIQAEVALRIAGALQARLAPGERERLEIWPTAEPVAYDLYLLGRDHLHRRTVADNHTAVSLFRRAIEIDPSFAHAYAGIARAHAQKVNRLGQPFEWADSAIHAAREAIALDPELADAHDAMAGGYFVQGHFGRAWAPAEAAIRLNPNHTAALTMLGSLHVEAGRLAEAVGYFRRAVALDPAGAEAALRNMAYAYARVGDFRRAEELLHQARTRWPESIGTAADAVLLPLLRGRLELARRRALELVARFPDYAGSWMIAGDVSLFSGDLPEARERYQRAYRMAPEAYYPVYTFRFSALTLGYVQWVMGERAMARALFQEFREFARREAARGLDAPAVQYMLAAVYAIEGDRAEAYRRLHEAVELGWSDHIFLARDPLFESLHDDAEFQDLVARNRQRMEIERALLEGDASRDR
jgi:TolB-like protein/DNA-binding SARP family transcriptional activator/tetratricopeptide (TPR) repeat protein